VLAYDPTQGKFVRLVPGATDNPAFMLHGGEAIYIYAKHGRTIVFTSLLKQAIDLKQGLNLVGIADPPTDYSAYDVLTNMGADRVRSMQHYNPQSGSFETAGFDEDGNLHGTDFTIATGEGYTISAIADFSWPLPSNP
jgi:hypothetical protein